MAWPGTRKRSEALGAIHRSVGEIPGLDPWGRPWDVQSEGRWNIENPPSESDTPFPPIEGCGPEQRYNEASPMPGCPVAPGSLRYLARTVTIAAGATGVFEFTSPGIFCPIRMMVTSDDVEFMFITKIATGIKNQIISGAVPAEVFGTENTCCPLACLDCICAPGVKLRVEILNTDTTPEDVTVVLIGTYYDIPVGMTAREAMRELPLGFDGCPVPGSDKMVGFSVTQEGQGIVEIEIETPGRFCPKQLFFQYTTDDVNFSLEDVAITGIRSVLEEQIIDSAIPATMWSIANKCCILSCFGCLCTPGVPLVITAVMPNNELPQTLSGVLIGSYEDVC